MTYIMYEISANCYKRIREETEAMQKAIEAELKLEPIDKEVVVLYDNEIQEKGSEFWQVLKLRLI